MKHTPWVLLASALLLGAIFDGLFFEADQPGINVFLFQVAILAVSLGLARLYKITIPRGAWIAATFATLYATTFAIWSSSLGLGLSVVGLLVSNFFFAVYLLGHHGKFHHPVETAVETVRRGLEIFFTRLPIIGHLKIPNLSPKKSAVVRGVLIAIPILLVFFALFLGSDLVLQKKTDSFFGHLADFLNSSELIAHIAIIAFVGLGFLLFFAATFWRRLTFNPFARLASKFRVESAIILVTLTILFGAFILFQSFYLFGGQAAFERMEGITYSAYAVHGFNELATVVILVMLLILTLRYFHAEDVNKKIITSAEIILLGETFLIVISAWIRMQLYVEQYGFTPARLFGFWFFGLSVILLILFAYHIVKCIPQYRFMHQAAIVIGVAMLIFTASAPDALAVRLNIARANENGQIDPFPLFNHLSAEALPAMHYVLTSDRFVIEPPQPDLREFCDFVAETTDDSYPRWHWTSYVGEIQEYEYFQNSMIGYNNHWYISIYGAGTQPLRINWRSWNFANANARKYAPDHLIPEGVRIEAADVAATCGLVHTED